MRFAGDKGDFTFEHVFYKDAALDDFLVGMELFVVGGDEEDHLVVRWCVARRRSSTRLVYSHAVAEPHRALAPCCPLLLFPAARESPAARSLF